MHTPSNKVLPSILTTRYLDFLMKHIVLYGNEVWCLPIKFDFVNWENIQLKLHLEFCKRVLQKMPNDEYRPTTGQYPLLLNIQKRAIQFWKHLKKSDPSTRAVARGFGAP